MSNDPINHPKHYTSHPSGIECIEITKHMSFTLGNAVKYIWRADLKHDAIEDLKKAAWYIQCEIAKRNPAPATPPSKSQFVLPLYDGNYQIFFMGGSSSKAVFNGGFWYFLSGTPVNLEVSHWVPL